MTPHKTRDLLISDTLAETLHVQTRHAAASFPPLRRWLVAGVMAVSMVMTQAAPVRADDNDELAAALAALALLGVILSQSDDDDRVDHDDRHRPPHVAHPYPSRDVWIPARCAITVEGRDRRDTVVYAEDCLDRHDIHRLPQRCAREIRYDGKRDWVYGAACLRDAGYRLQDNDRLRHDRQD